MRKLRDTLKPLKRVPGLSKIIMPLVLKRNDFRLRRDTAKEIGEFSGYNCLWLMRDIKRSRIRYGASVEDYVAMEFYRKSRREKDTFNTFMRNFVELFGLFCDDYAVEVFDHKENFAKVFKDYLKHDCIFASETTVGDGHSIADFISNYGSVIVKPTDGCEGIGVYKLDSDNKFAVEELFSDIRNGKSFMLEQLIIQHPDMEKLNPSSVNTIRIETIIDSKGEVHVTNTIVIMGTGNSVVNNTHSGGIMCHVEQETGIIDSFGRNPKGEQYFRNPATDVILPGYQIPMWNGILDYAKQLAMVVPSARQIGWDIAITENGYDIIEGNVRPGHCTQACDMKGRYQLLKSLV